ncbi:hypothetical protein [Hymenobacter weizhouensis]|uniref:hypothetical protein n=1 Tax=Hymenobacter sp. YIM 151500-1 TaxID=2987689 RepID=UPI002225ED57|nr:hypothetical protein [Hymenobacter sp. YIM 151500-1]UYZ62944.1 hypothetical protein OIS53_18365 [Hymenobacter sp. YIM 151500-1]
MQISKQLDLRDGSSCELTYNEADNWIRATWIGYVDPREAYQGATTFLEVQEDWQCPYLLNDNSRLRGPWFDSVEWLTTVWAPHAQRFGLRFIAHVAQPQDLLAQAAALSDGQPFGPDLQVQMFDDLASAEEWLRQMQRAES